MLPALAPRTGLRVLTQAFAPRTVSRRAEGTAGQSLKGRSLTRIPRRPFADVDGTCRACHVVRFPTPTPDTH